MEERELSAVSDLRHSGIVVRRYSDDRQIANRNASAVSRVHYPPSIRIFSITYASITLLP